jgi:hypothetical protein
MILIRADVEVPRSRRGVPRQGTVGSHENGRARRVRGIASAVRRERVRTRSARLYAAIRSSASLPDVIVEGADDHLGQ